MAEGSGLQTLWQCQGRMLRCAETRHRGGVIGAFNWSYSEQSARRGRLHLFQMKGIEHDGFKVWARALGDASAAVKGNVDGVVQECENNAAGSIL